MTLDTSTNPTTCPALDVARELGVDVDHGLSAAVALARLQADGPNELRPIPPTRLWRRVFRQFKDPLVSLLLVAIVISVLAWIAEGAAGPPIDAIVIAAIVIVNAALGLAQESRAERAVAALASLTVATSTVVRDGRLATVPSRDLVRGDILSLSEGDAVGADARLVTATGLLVQEASLTGESEPTQKTPEPLEAPAALGDRHNMVHAGTAVVRGVGRAVVIRTGMDTELGSIAELLDRTDSEPSPLQREIASVSKTLGLLVIGIAIIVMAVTAVINGVDGASQGVAILLMGVSLAVAAVPEGLPAILSLVLALGVRRMARHHAVMKDPHSFETLGSASVICTDKTGTLTRNEMTLRRVVTPVGVMDITGVGYQPLGEARPLGATEDPGALTAAVRDVLVAGALANNAQLQVRDGDWRVEGDPTEGAFLVAVPKLDGARDRVARYRRESEVPFTSERKMMSVLGHDEEADEHRLFVKGAPDILLERCTQMRVAGAAVPLSAAARQQFLDAVDALSGEAFRTLGVAYREMPARHGGAHGVDESAESNLVLLGVVGIIDPPRDEARVAVAEARRAGVRTVMITGDHPRTALRIASDLGIAGRNDRALTGTEIEQLDPDTLGEAVLKVSVFARVAPEHKLRIIDALQAQGLIVAMTGDGVNDAPALKSADIGIAMGITGTEVTKEAATMILADDNFGTIVDAIRQGRVIFDNIRKFLRYLLSSNLGEVATVFFGVAFAGALGLAEASEPGALVLPLLATQILWINLVTDSGPALAMGIDSELDDVMARPPRPENDPILNREMWLRIGFIGVVMAVVTLLTIDVFLPGGLVEGSDSIVVARTAGFTTLVFAQLFNALTSRSETTSAFRHLFDNRWLWASLLLAAALQVAVVHVAPLRNAFGTTSLDLAHWAVTIGMASLILWLEEFVKLVRRRRRG